MTCHHQAACSGGCRSIRIPWGGAGMCGVGLQELVQVELGHQHAVSPSGPGLMHTPQKVCVAPLTS